MHGLPKDPTESSFVGQYLELCWAPLTEIPVLVFTRSAQCRGHYTRKGFSSRREQILRS